MTVQTTTGVVRVSCGGKPLDTDYIPSALKLAELGRYFAARYAAKDETEESA